MRPLVCVAGLLVACASHPPQGETSSTIGYESVRDAFEALQQKPGTQLTNRGGLMVIRDDEARTMWSFVPEGHAAYPAVAKASLVIVDGRGRVDLRIKCESTKEACDAFAADMAARTSEAARRTKEQ